MKEFNLLHSETLYIRFSAIYGDKFVKSYHHDDFKKVWYAEWAEGLKGINVTVIKDSLEYCKQNVEWPPSIAEFRNICEKYSGIPSCYDCLKAAIRGDFTHQLTKMSYDKVGSWDMKNSKEQILIQKFKTAYQEALTEFRNNLNYNYKKIEVSAPSNQPLLEHEKQNEKKIFINWKERLKIHKEQNKNEYHEQNYDTIRRERQLEGYRAVKKPDPICDIPSEKKIKSSGYFKPRRVNEYWNN